MKKAVRILPGGLFCIYITSCGANDNVVASVDDKELTEREAFVLMEHLGYDFQNREEYMKFLEDWCRNTAYIAELEAVSPETAELIRLRSESFQGELAKYHLEELQLRKKLDTIVTPREIRDFYNERKDEFVLHDYLVKALYLKIPSNLDFKSKNIHQRFLLKNDKDLSEINSYAKLYAENYYFNDSSWVFFNELAKDIPTTEYNVDNIVLNRSKTYFSDNEHTYFINIIDFKLKDEAPPLDFLADQIREIIVLNRLERLKEKNESSMIQSIKDKHEITINY